MNTSFRSLMFCLTSILASHAAIAAEKAAHLDVLTCQKSGGTKISDNVYAYTLGTGSGNPRYLTIYLAGDKFNAWAVEEYFGTGFLDCTSSGLPGITVSTLKVVDVSSAGVGVDVDAGSLSEDSINQRYTEVTLSYTMLTLASNSTPEIAVGSKEEQQKALAAFQARGLALPKH